MTKPISNLTPDHERAVRDCLQSLRDVQRVAHLLRPNTYQATQRDILRKLVRAVITNAVV